MRPGDEKTAIVLAMQDELTALGLLAAEPGTPVQRIERPKDETGALACGTAAAHRRHYRNHEPPCDPCRAAYADYRAGRRAA